MTAEERQAQRAAWYAALLIRYNEAIALDHVRPYQVTYGA